MVERKQEEKTKMDRKISPFRITSAISRCNLAFLISSMAARDVYGGIGQSGVIL